MATTPEMPKMPMMPFDFSKMMGEFDPTKMMSSLTAMMQQYKLPGVDVDAMVAAQKKNLEALTAANKTALEGMQTLAKRQAEILQESMNQAAKAIDDMSKSSSPNEAAAKQIQLAKDTFEKALATMREMAEIMGRSSRDASDKINVRITESLEEFKEMAAKMKG